ncbi:hypothetical protein [Bradyrhizobium lablabi]|uniref:hypothetical protein n=1 Tax=Bradyrhizobium lablabi TaxID=722472 RepID=UPI001BAD950B|nr:hypothetical protein [Bradyrhizobium lablabi]MBR0697813.1 hypothetical protein [Bradyrhizobium lablabi]
MRGLFAITIVSTILTMSGAEAFPAMGQLSSIAPASVVTEVKVVCDEGGNCYRPPKRRPVATWVYGDNNFVGPYVGPGNYGSPQYRYRWWPFW